MRKICIIGNLAEGTESFNGQTIKTRIVARHLKHVYGDGNVRCVDTAGGLKAIAGMLVRIVECVMGCRNIVILPAQNGIKVILPLVVLCNAVFGRRIHYVVIGGWLPDFLKRHAWLLPLARRLYMIYPETHNAKSELCRLGLSRVTVMPNCKPLGILTPEQLHLGAHNPLRLCLFSRITATKGVEDAVRAVQMANQKMGRMVARLDIYGKVDDMAWFDRLKLSFGGSVSYNGCVAYDRSVETLRGYDALLFPTYYPGEGLAGTVIDAFAAGLPVIASDWHDNANVVADGVTGFVFPVRDVARMADIILGICDNPDVLAPMKRECLRAAKGYLPENVLTILQDNLL